METTPIAELLLVTCRGSQNVNTFCGGQWERLGQNLGLAAVCKNVLMYPAITLQSEGQDHHGDEDDAGPSPQAYQACPGTARTCLLHTA